MEKVKIRKANAGDAEIVAFLLFDSGPEAFQYVFNTGGKTALDFLNYSFREKGGEFGHGCHSCILLDDTIIGIGAEFSGENAISFLWHNAKQIVLFYGWRAAGVIFRGLKVERVLVPPKKNVHYIAHLDISENYRGKGMGTKLIEHFIENSKMLNRRLLELDVAVTNPEAKKLYTRLGFEADHVRESTLKRNGICVPSYERMKKLRA